MNIKTAGLLLAVVVFALYTFIGCGTRVDKIKELAPVEIKKRGWEIMRYEGFQYGSFAKHGGKVWYHVMNTDNSEVQYRVHVTLWGDELQFYYDQPEQLNRIEIQHIGGK